MDAYVYGVTRASAGWRPSFEGVDEQPVEVVAKGELAGLVSDAPSVPVKTSRRNLMAHSQVLQQVIAERCVLPMRFGVVMPDRAAVEEELLAANGERLEAQLRAFEPFVELDVRALCPEERLLRMVVTGRADLAELREAIRGRPGVATYYDRIRLGELVAQAVAEKREEAAGRIGAAPRPLAGARERREEEIVDGR